MVLESTELYTMNELHELLSDFDPGEVPDHWVPMADIEDEVLRQVELWGEQNHEDGTGPRNVLIDNAENGAVSQLLKARNNKQHTDGKDDWATILGEEFFEALSETDQQLLYKELCQTAAVCISWMVDITGRQNVRS